MVSLNIPLVMRDDLWISLRVYRDKVPKGRRYLGPGRWAYDWPFISVIVEQWHER